MTKQKIRLLQLFFAIALTCSFSLVQAQPPDDPGEDPDPPPNTEIPFDGGISLLVAAGVAYAAKKGYDKKNKGKVTGDVEK